MRCRFPNAFCGVILMYNISLFVEDQTHELFILTLTQRLADMHQVKINPALYNVRGGRGKVMRALKKYQRDLQSNREDLPDLIIVGTDSNCKGLSERETEINQATSDLADLVITMIPEPHIERWLLLDSEAFKMVFGKGCPVPDQKCERDRYKNMLLNAIYDATRVAPLDRVERVEELVYAMDFQRIGRSDSSIHRFLTALQRRFRIWQQIDG